MKKKKIFSNKKSINKILFFSIILFFLTLLSLLVINKKNEFFIIEEFSDNYYKIPYNKEGKIIPNKNKQVLHLNFDTDRIALKSKDLIKYSIQFYASIFYEEVKKKLEFYLQKDIFNNNDFSIVILEHSIGREYILIYKNFETNNSAYEYCSNHLKIINPCLIINVQNLD